MPAPSTALSKEEHHATHKDVLLPFNHYGGAYSLGAWQGVTHAISLPNMVRRGLPFQVLFCTMTWLTL